MIAVTETTYQNAEHCAAKFHIPHCTVNAQEIFESPNVDVVFILTSDEYHEPYTIAALQAGKHVMLEKPISLSIPSAQRIIDAEAKARGPRVFVGYMRRYALSFTQTFKREIADIPRILYARARDFPGPNAKFENESGTFQVRNTDFPPEAGEQRDKLLKNLYAEAFPESKEITPQHISLCRFLGSLGSHDLSLLREVFGMPESIAGVTINEPFHSALFNYRNKGGNKEHFSLTYESGIDAVPEFDAHLAVYGEKKRVTIYYDSPFVKGLPIKVKVQEVNDAGEMSTREILGSYEDAYTAELKELWACIVERKDIKTSAEDAMQELKIFDMIYRKWKNRS